MNTENYFIGFEYKELLVSPKMASLCIDCMPSFGWQSDKNDSSFGGILATQLKFKRERNIKNKSELTKMEQQFEANIKAIESLERKKLTSAQIASLAIGIAGAAFMAGSVFTYLAGMILLMIILSIPGFFCDIVFAQYKVTTFYSLHIVCSKRS